MTSIGVALLKTNYNSNNSSNTTSYTISSIAPWPLVCCLQPNATQIGSRDSWCLMSKICSHSQRKSVQTLNSKIKGFQRFLCTNCRGTFERIIPVFCLQRQSEDNYKKSVRISSLLFDISYSLKHFKYKGYATPNTVGGAQIPGAKMPGILNFVPLSLTSVSHQCGPCFMSRT